MALDVHATDAKEASTRMMKGFIEHYLAQIRVQENSELVIPGLGKSDLRGNKASKRFNGDLGRSLGHRLTCGTPSRFPGELGG